MIKNLCILIPSDNESKTIGRIIRHLKGRGLVVYVVDDGSIDDTAKIAESEKAVVLKHRENKGKGASLIEGFRHVLKKNYDAVLVMDGDNQHDPSDINNFVEEANQTGADMVIGNRMNDTSSMPYIRTVTNKWMSGIISFLSGQRILDSQCGFRLIKKEVLEKIELESSNYEIESELILKAARGGFKIGSVPIKTVYQNEKSRINPFLDTIRFVRFMLKFLFER